MLQVELEVVWRSTSDLERQAAKRQAKLLLMNLIHYNSGRTYLDDDINMVAASLVAWHRSQSNG